MTILLYQFITRLASMMGLHRLPLVRLPSPHVHFSTSNRGVGNCLIDVAFVTTP